MKKETNRRKFLANVSLLGAGAVFGTPLIARSTFNKPAILGGKSSVTAYASGWPIFGDLERTELMNTLNSGVWGRLAANTRTDKFERGYEKITGSKHALGVSSGTAALHCMLGALDIGPGDEVILPPYTFIATYNAIGLHHALPIFVDTDIESFQIDATKIEKSINKNTKALLPVHIGGSPFNIDAVAQIGKRHNIPVIEDACQAHLATWKGRGVGNYGIGGAFSFQATKNLNSGEGGAIITNDTDFYQRCYGFHHQGQTSNSASLATGSGTRGSNLRITEFQSTILSAQMTRLEQQAENRWDNAQYLTRLFNEIPGIEPAKLYPGTTRSAFHLYMFRFNSEQFEGLSRDGFINALNAEGIGCGAGYGMINKDAYVTNLAKNRHYLKVYGKKRMKRWLDQTLDTPVNDRLTKEAVWFTQTQLLGSHADMDAIANAVRRIRKSASKLK